MSVLKATCNSLVMNMYPALSQFPGDFSMGRPRPRPQPFLILIWLTTEETDISPTPGYQAQHDNEQFGLDYDFGARTFKKRLPFGGKRGQKDEGAKATSSVADAVVGQYPFYAMMSYVCEGMNT